MTTLNQDQLKMLQALLDGISALKGSVGMTTSAPAKTSAKKVKDPNAPKRKPHAVIEEQKAVYAEMKAAYRTENDISDETKDEDIRKMAKEGKLPKYPTYPDALKEYSRRRAENDPEHARKTQKRREELDQILIKRRAERKTKGSSKSSDTTSVVTADESDSASESAPAPPPAPAPAAEKPKKKITLAKSVKNPPPPNHEIMIASETDDPEEYNKILKTDGKTYAMNGMNHVATTDGDWIGIWDPISCKINECPQPEESDDDNEE